jgi:hypothetical protein
MLSRELMIRLGAVAITACLALACGSGAAAVHVRGVQTVDQPECLNTGLAFARISDAGASLVASVPTTVGEFVHWEENRSKSVRPSSPQRGRVSGERLVMCYYDGTFAGMPMPPAPPNAAPRLPYDRILVAVMNDGTVRLVSAGYRGSLPATGPVLP